MSHKSRVFPCGRTDMTKPRLAFRKFANTPQVYVAICFVTVADKGIITELLYFCCT